MQHRIQIGQIYYSDLHRARGVSMVSLSEAMLAFQAKLFERLVDRFGPDVQMERVLIPEGLAIEFHALIPADLPAPSEAELQALLSG